VQISYKQNEDSIEKALAHSSNLLKTKLKCKRWILGNLVQIFSASFFVAVPAMFFFISIDLNKFFFLIYLLVAGFVTSRIFIFINRKKMRMLIKGETSLEDEIQISTDDAGIKIISEYSTTSIRQKAIRSVEISKDYLFLELPKFGVIAIPSSAFRSESDAREFREQLLDQS
jgi:hypothetical protein